MSVPKANPIKFWIEGETSFNNEQVPNVIQACFHHPWKSTSTIKVMVIDEVGAVIYLDVYNIDDELQTSVLFADAGANGVFIASLALSTYEGEKIYFQIRKEATIFSSEFASDLDSWANNGAGANDWAWSAAESGCASLQYTAPNTGKDLRRSIVVPASANASNLINGKLTIDVALTGGFASLTARTKDVSEVELGEITGINADGTYTFEAGEIQNAAYIDFREVGSGIGVAYTWRIRSVSLIANYSLGISDAIQVVLSTEPEHNEIVSIQFGDRNTYAGLQYSPVTTLFIDVPARFYKERSPEETEAEEFGDSSVTMLSNSVKDQRMLETEPLPQFLCKILKRIFNHNTLYIDGKYWVREEAVEEIDVSERSPFKKLRVWLTDRDSYDTNVYSQQITV